MDTETLALETSADGQIVLRGTAYQRVGGSGFSSISLDTLNGRPAADFRSIGGTWRDASGRSGRWTFARADNVAMGMPNKPASSNDVSATTRDSESERRERERIAKLPTRVIATYEFPRWSFARGMRELEITDTSVVSYTKENPQSKNTLGYWQVDSFQMWGTHLAYIPTGRTGRPYALETLLHDGLITDSDKAKILSQLVDAHRAWTARFPDRASWIPSDRGVPAQ